MANEHKVLPKWILIVSGLIAVMEFAVSLSMYISPQSILETIDHSAKGINYIIYMWAARQFALGFIFAFATWKKSIQMLTISYVFFLVMFVGDFFIGAMHKETSLIISALVMCIISSALLYVINKKRG